MARRNYGIGVRNEPSLERSRLPSRRDKAIAIFFILVALIAMSTLILIKHTYPF